MTAIQEKFEKIESELLQPGMSSGRGWYGIHFRWQAGCLKDGCTLKRGKQYGRIEYRLYPSTRILTRDEALKEVLTPLELRKAFQDIESLRSCAVCRCSEMGEDLEHWQRVMCFEPSGIKRTFLGELEPTFKHKWLDLCDRCVTAIGEGRCSLAQERLE